jgi:glutamate-ammonia-ligase adenylyltransferase
LAQAFERVRAEVLTQKRDPEKLKVEVREMRQKMRTHLGSSAKDGELNLIHLKQDAGGIVDIEFMVQYAVLAWAHREPSLAEFTDNIRILGALENAGLLAGESVAQLIDAYKALRSAGHRLALQRQEAVLHDDERFVAERNLVISLWRQLLETGG